MLSDRVIKITHPRGKGISADIDVRLSLNQSNRNEHCCVAG